MEVSYLPEGMVETEEGKYSYADALNKGGVSIVFYKMDTGDAQFDMLTTDVKSAEEIRIGGYDGIYCELIGGEGEGISFNQRIYVAYTDVHYVMEMYVASDVAKEEALKIAEGVHLQPVSGENAQNIVHAYNWSEFVQEEKEEGIGWSAALSIPKSAMANTHAVGESFAAAHVASPEDDWLGLGNVEIRVTDVQVSDNVSLLDQSLMDSDERASCRRRLMRRENCFRLRSTISSMAMASIPSMRWRTAAQCRRSLSMPRSSTQTQEAGNWMKSCSMEP